MSHENLIVIDLTSSSTLDEIINIDSDREESSVIEAKSKDKSSNTNNPQLFKQKQSGVKKIIKHQKKPKFGHCPICCDKFGTNPLVATKCGHIYCRKCLEKVLKPWKQCQICRCKLLGKSAYHSLYLSCVNKKF